MENPLGPLSWHALDLSAVLPDDWSAEVVQVAKNFHNSKVLTRPSVTSREDVDPRGLLVHLVRGEVVQDQLSWLVDLYMTEFREYAQRFFDEEVIPAKRLNNAINLNVQFVHNERYECHVDSNPIAALLYATTHAPGTGGELVVANREEAWGVEEIGSSASRIYPVTGQIVFFDGRRRPHYVERLRDPHGVRVVVAMSYYTGLCPESLRPHDLDEHLFTD